MSRRRIAHEVFGDERLRGRVDRIVRDEQAGNTRAALGRAPDHAGTDPAASVTDFETVPALEDLFPLYARSLRRRLADPLERVSAAELLTFARLELWVENKRRVAELNALTRAEPARPTVPR